MNVMTTQAANDYDTAIRLTEVTKVFGSDPERAWRELQSGRSKADIQAETGMVVGLDRVSLEVTAGRIHVVMGLSGSGKSTLVRHVNRLIEPTAGEIEVAGMNVRAMSLPELRTFRRNKVAMVFQKFGLLPHRTVLDNVAYGLEVRGTPRAQRLASAAHWIETVGLKGYEAARPRQLSGGQQQRVGLARALALDTDILLMDEAFSALDPLIRSGMQDELLRLQRDLNKTILFITHDFDEALKIGDRVTVLKDGAVIQDGKPEEIVLHPANEHVAEFVKNVNKARAIRVRTIMDPVASEPCELAVPSDTRCEDVLPLFADHQWVGVEDNDGKQIGRLTAKRVINALASHVGPAEQSHKPEKETA